MFISILSNNFIYQNIYYENTLIQERGDKYMIYLNSYFYQISSCLDEDQDLCMMYNLPNIENRKISIILDHICRQETITEENKDKVIKNIYKIEKRILEKFLIKKSIELYRIRFLGPLPNEFDYRLLDMRLIELMQNMIPEERNNL